MKTPCYRCEFLFYRDGNPQRMAIDINGLAGIREGFWLNEKLEYSYNTDVRYWIPPYQILYIEKIA